MKNLTILLVALSFVLSGCNTTESTILSNTAIKDDADLALLILTQGLDEPPKIKSGKHPAHPMGQGANDGLAVIEFTINKKGKTEDMETIRKEGEGYAGNAKYAIRYWRFHPALKDGEPVDCRVRYGVGFEGSRTNSNFKMD